MIITTICPFEVELIGLLNLWGDVIGREILFNYTEYRQFNNWNVAVWVDLCR